MIQNKRQINKIEKRLKYCLQFTTPHGKNESIRICRLLHQCNFKSQH